MTLDDLYGLADKFFEWPEGSGRQAVTTFSALLFAQHVLKLREKSLGTENSAGMDALRNAAQQALKALEHYATDETPEGWHAIAAITALRAALEQQAEPEPVAWVRLESWKSGEEWPDDCFTAEKSEGLTPLYTAPPQRKPLTDAEIDKLFGAVADAPRAHWLRQAAIEVVRKTEAAHGIGEEE